MNNNIEKINSLEQRIQALESRLNFNQDSDIEAHINRLKARKQSLELEINPR